MADLWIPGGYGSPPTLLGGARTPSDGVSVELPGWSATAGARTPHGDSWVATLGEWSGWHGGWGVETMSQQSPTGDGTISGTGTHGARTITLSGLVKANQRSVSRRAVLEAGDALAAVLSGDKRKGVLIVREPERGLVRECEVRLAQSPDYDDIASNVAAWTMYLVADDPLRYATEEQVIQVGKTATVRNRGKVLSRPILNVYGPLVDPYWEAGGNRLTVKTTIPAGNALTLDTRRRVVLDSNGVRYPVQVTGYWHHLQPGDTAMTFGAASGTGYGQLRRMSAWM